MWGWLTGGSAKKSQRVVEAEACFTKDELRQLQQAFNAALQAQGPQLAQQGVLKEHAFLAVLCGLPAAAPQRSQPALLGLYHQCAGCAADATGSSSTHGVSLHDLLVAKAACERQSTSESCAFAFALLCRISAAITGGGAALGPQAPHPPQALAQDQVKQCLVALTSLLTDLRCLPSSSLSQQAQPAAAPGAAPPAATGALGTATPQGASSEPQSTSSSAATLTPQSGSTTSLQPPPSSSTITTTTTTVTRPSAGSHSAAEWLEACARGALWAAPGPAATSPATTLDEEGYARWAKACPAWHSVLTGLLFRAGATTTGNSNPTATSAVQPGRAPGSAAPQGQGGDSAGWSARLPHTPTLLYIPPGTSASSADVVRAASAQVPSGGAGLLLHPLAALVLAQHLPPSHRHEWRLVFSSNRDGKSYNTLLGRLAAVEGATLLLVRESSEQGHLVAGYGPAPWRKSGAFFGDSTSWVARLLPDLQVFKATGANTNFQWCGQGFTQLTNGLGFGGAAGAHAAFALLLDSTLDAGQSRPIATYGSPSLTTAQVFQVAEVECWLLEVPEPDELDASSKGKKGASVLDKANADRIILGLAGKQVNHSAGLRHEEPT